MLHVALIWHMHQPDYRDPETGVWELPWVRLHAVKDYLDMVRLVEAFPTVHQTFNLVPSLLDQIEAYAAGRAVDRHMQLSTVPVGAWRPGERAEIVERFVDLSQERMLDPFPRLRELAGRRDLLRHEGLSWQEVAERFSDQDLIDLCVLYHLAWTDPRWRHEDPQLAALAAKGRDFHPDDRQRVLDRHQALLAQVIPSFRHAAEQGLVELSTSPYHHPILPLLCDSDVAARSLPDAPLPTPPFRYPQDADEQLRLAFAAHERRFGQAPAGVWPSELAVSPEALDAIARAGAQWVMGAESVLAQTLETGFGRNSQGVPDGAEQLYTAYRWRQGPRLIFRDRVLSDRIGFTYTRWGALAAARDLYARLKAIAARTVRPEAPPPLVTIALAGENSWEFYAEDGGPFLRAFFALVAADPQLRCVTVGEHLAAVSAVPTLTTIHTGSWVRSDLGAWIGEPTKNRAWQELHAARQAVAEAAEVSREVAEHLAIAEGSDWFWWYGEGYSSAQDAVFDRLFRRRLQAVYEGLGLPVPACLAQSLYEARPLATALAEDGWRWSRTVSLAASRGTMHRTDRNAGRLTWGGSAKGDWCLHWGTEEGGSQGGRLELALTVLGAEGGCEIPETGLRAHYRLLGDLATGQARLEAARGSEWVEQRRFDGTQIGDGWAWRVPELPRRDLAATIGLPRSEREAAVDTVRLAWQADQG